MKKTVMLVIVSFLALFNLCISDTIHVPADQPTIQAGIDTAINGDSVLVAPGTYNERIDFNGKKIALESSHGAEVTIIDGEQLGSVVNFQQGEDGQTLICGFSITNGKHTIRGGGIYCYQSSPRIIENIISKNYSGLGGGIYCEEASPDIKDNVISYNECVFHEKYGGGIYCLSSSPLIENNVIEWNRAFPNAKTHGGGICCVHDSRPLILNNDIEKNYGGAVLCHDGPRPVIRGNFMKRNIANTGAGVHSWKASPLIESNTLVKNYWYGIKCVDSDVVIRGNSISEHEENGILFNSSCGLITGNIISKNGREGIRCYGYCENVLVAQNLIQGNGRGVSLSQCINPIITRNTILENHTAYDGGGIISYSCEKIAISNNFICRNHSNRNGGGLYLYGTEDETVANNTFCDNWATNKGGGLYYDGPSNLEIQNCILWGNTTKQIEGDVDAVYCNIEGGYPGTGNIDLDPMFVDSLNNDYHLLSASPCRNAGDNSFVVDPHDAEMDPRIADGQVDMGADEFYPHLYCIGDMNPGDDLRINLIGMPGASPAALFIGYDVLDPPLPCAWGNFHLTEPWIMFALSPLPPSGVISIDTTMPLWAAPYEIPMQALLDWELTNLCTLKVIRY